MFYPLTAMPFRDCGKLLAMHGIPHLRSVGTIIVEHYDYIWQPNCNKQKTNKKLFQMIMLEIFPVSQFFQLVARAMRILKIYAYGPF